MRLRRSLAAALVFALATSHLFAGVSLVGQVGRLFRSDSTTPVPVGSIAVLVADTDKATQPGLVNPLGTTLTVGQTLGGASGDLIVGVYSASTLSSGVVGVDLGGTTLTYTGALTAGTDLWLVWFPGVSTTGSPVGASEPYGAYRSSTVDTASQSDIAFVTPADGATSSLYAYSSSLGFGLATDGELSATSVTSTPHDVHGTYFGTFTSGGHWALYVRSDNTATYIAYLPSRSSAIVVNLTVGLNGSFSVTGTEAKSAAAMRNVALETPGSSVRRAAAAAGDFTLTGQIAADGTVSGQLTGFGESFTGTVDNVAAQAPAGLYTTSALNTASGSTTAIVGPSGQAVVVTTGASVDGAAGTVNASGQFSAVTSNSATLALSIDTAGQKVTATLTPSGGAPISYSGLPDSVTSTARVVNLSVRSSAGTGDQTLIVGFVVTGTGNKTLLLRGIGPSLAGVGNTLADPRLLLLDRQGAEIEVNNDWGGSPTMVANFFSVGASTLAADSKDAAVYRAISSGVYSFHVLPHASGSGVALAELYDGDLAPVPAQVVNISARTEVGTGENILIAGFVITGNAPKTLLIRGQGPSLTLGGVTGVLADPQLSLYKVSVLITANDNWGGTPELKTAFSTVGAGALVSDSSKDAALLVTLEPGVYSATVSGVGGTTGIGLVEIFVLP